MTANEKEIIKKIKEKIERKDPGAEIILFGSHARGQSHPDSDWDIIILVNGTKITRSKETNFRNELFEVELETGEPISTFVFSKKEWNSKYSVTPLFFNVEKEGVFL